MPSYETREFTTGELDDMDVAAGGACVLLDEVVDHMRWSVVHRVVFMFEGEFFEVTYEDGATEYQEVDRWGHGDTVTAKRVRPKTVTTVTFEPIPLRS